jgi:hypothetical protein
MYTVENFEARMRQIGKTQIQGFLSHCVKQAFSAAFPNDK